MPRHRPERLTCPHNTASTRVSPTRHRIKNRLRARVEKHSATFREPPRQSPAPGIRPRMPDLPAKTPRPLGRPSRKRARFLRERPRSRPSGRLFFADQGERTQRARILRAGAARPRRTTMRAPTQPRERSKRRATTRRRGFGLPGKRLCYLFITHALARATIPRLM